MLLATGYTEGVGGGSGATSSFDGPVVTLNSPPDEAKLLGDKVATVAPTGNRGWWEEASPAVVACPLPGSLGRNGHPRGCLARTGLTGTRHDGASCLFLPSVSTAQAWCSC